MKIDVFEYAPVGKQTQGITAHSRFFRHGAPVDIRVIVVLPEIIRCDRIIHLHNRTLFHKRFDDFPRR
ncbi:hypothetical protein D3C73_1537930 [compost metagenome]